MCSLGRFVLGCACSPAAGQTSRRPSGWSCTLDDKSAIRRLTLPQGFLAVDAILNLYQNVVPGLGVHPAIIARHVADELPFMATENLLMAAVQEGGDRQDLHERDPRARDGGRRAAQGRSAADNDLLDRIRRDPAFPPLDLDDVLAPGRYIGRSGPAEVEEFIAREVEPIRRRYPAPPPEDPDDRGAHI